MSNDPTTWKVIESFEADYPDLATESEFFFRRNFFNTFMDVLGNYIGWRESGKRPNSFLNRQLKNWGVQSWIDEYPSSVLKRMVISGGSTLQINDETTISTVLAQQFFDRKVVTADKKKALVCINRQSSNIILNHLNYPNIEEAQKEFEGLVKVIETKLG